MRFFAYAVGVPIATLAMLPWLAGVSPVWVPLCVWLLFVALPAFMAWVGEEMAAEGSAHDLWGLLETEADAKARNISDIAEDGFRRMVEATREATGAGAGHEEAIEGYLIEGDDDAGWWQE